MSDLPATKIKGGSMALAAMLKAQAQQAPAEGNKSSEATPVPAQIPAAAPAPAPVPAPAPAPVSTPSEPTVEIDYSTSNIKPSAGTKRASVVQTSSTPKCIVCEKSVYKMEEVIAINKTWHKNCFTCGGKNSDGCGRTLKLDSYLDHDGEPYCNACYSKLFRPKGFGYGSTLQTSYGKSAEEEVSHARDVLGTPSKETTAPAAPVPKPVTSSTVKVATNNVPESTTTAKPAFTNSATTKVAAAVGAMTPKCTICAKSVYKMEEVNALSRLWHKSCFTCGGNAKDGCGRVLKLDGYLDHDNQPYCNACYSKLFRPKGFGFGNTLNTDYGMTSEEEVNNAREALGTASISSNEEQTQESTTSTTTFKKSFTGGSAGLAGRLAARNNVQTTAPPAEPVVATAPVPPPAPVSVPPAPAPKVVAKPPAVPVEPQPPAPKVALKPAPTSTTTTTSSTTKTVPAPATASSNAAYNLPQVSAQGSKPVIGRTKDALYKEAQYSGDGGEVDDSEW